MIRRISYSGARGLYLAGGLAVLGGCNDEGRLVGQRARHVEVGVVTDQGLTLDKEAGPKEVVYVLLRAIKDDLESGDDYEAREAAFDRQLNVCAPDTISQRSVRKQLGRDENVRRIVWHWAPTLAFYKDDFPPDWPTAGRRLLEARKLNDRDPDGDQWTNVSLELQDPSGEPSASVVARFQLVREGGYWRVVRVGFSRRARHLGV